MEKELLMIKFSGDNTTFQIRKIVKETNEFFIVLEFGKEKKINKNKIDIIDSVTGNFLRVIENKDYETEINKCLQIFIDEQNFKIKLIQDNKNSTIKKLKELIGNEK